MKKWALIVTLILGLIACSACEMASSKSDSPTPSSHAPIPPEPQDIVFKAADGKTLEGRYYPAVTIPAPMIVLMHWYPGDQNDWSEIAYWLQNRGLEGEGDGVPWRNPSWFPVLPESSSWAVFTFTFRNCAGGCQEPDPAGWLLDARAAMERAAALPGVDPNRVVSMGTSIGGDGAIAGCAWLQTQPEGNCLGALSLSPGGYLIDSYPNLVEELGRTSPPPQAWCFYDENEETAEICSPISKSYYHAEGWSDGNLHGFHLLNPNLEPNPLDLLIEFLYTSGATQP